MASASILNSPQEKALRRKLCLMMFLQFFIWGAWFELGFDYIPKLGFSGWQNGLIFGAFNIGALVALFFSTQFADRKFAAEKFVAFSHLIGGLAILGLYFLPLRVGTEADQIASVRIDGPAQAKPGRPQTSGVGVLPNIPNVEVYNVVASSPEDDPEIADTPEARDRLKAYLAATPKERNEKKLGEGLGNATKFWAAFQQDLTKYENASEEVRKEEKLKDPRFVTTFVVTESKPRELVGNAKLPLAPFWPFFALMLIHAVFYVPTISITNSIAFANLRDPQAEFGPVRVWGTIGWIVASWPFIFILVDWVKVPAMGNDVLGWLGTALGTSVAGATAMDMKKSIFLVAGIAALVLAAYSLFLPHTPPKPAKSAADSLAWVKAARFLKHPFIAVLFLVTFIDAAVHQSFFYWTFTFLGPKADGGVVDIPSNWVGPVMKIGQIAEIVTMLFLGYVLKRCGWRITMIVGVLGHGARFAVFAYYPEPWAAILINAVHGICYAFFFATVYIFVDAFFPKDVRSSAQGLFNVLILGVGPFAANFACGILKELYTDPTTKALNYTAVFQYSAGAALVGAILLALFFHPPEKGFAETEVDEPEEKAPPVA